MDNKSVLQEEYQLKRKKRVQRLRRNIITLVAILLLVPTIICIFLAVKVGSLQRQIDYLYEAKFGDGPIAIDDDVVNMSDWETDYSIVSVGTESVERTIANNNLGLGLKKERRKVYLTFDDGPSDYTGDILSILREYNVKATFFVVGKEKDELIPYYQQIVDEGHTLAMHSYSHQYSEIYESVDAFKADFKKIRDLLENETGIVSNYYRFPGGSSNQVSNLDMKEFIKFLNKEGVTYFDWNAANGDATSKTYTVTELVNNVLNGIKAKEDTIVLMHDTNAKGTTVKSLPILLEELKKMDVDIVPIDENTKPVQHINAEMANN